MKFLIVATGSHGHVLPFVGLGRVLQRARACCACRGSRALPPPNGCAPMNLPLLAQTDAHA